MQAGATSEQGMQLLADREFQQAVIKEIGYLTGIDLKPLAPLRVALEAEAGDDKALQLPPLNITERDTKKLTLSQSTLRSMATISDYIQAHPDQQEAVGVLISVAQGPKGVAQYAVLQVVAKTPVGKAFEDQVAQYSDLLGKAVADSLEGMTLDERNEFENSLVGGGKLITSVLTGAVPGRRVHGDRKTVSVEKSPSEPRPSDRVPCCFAAGTKVSTPAGDRVIESLKVGAIVWTKPERGGKPFAARILATHQRSDQPIYRLKLKSIRGSEAVSSETLLVTPSHPFYVPAQRGFVSVIDLKPGDRLQSLADGNSEDSSSEVESLELYLSVGTTYNLTVDVGHTFYVGEMRTWVHNVGPCDTVPNGGTKATATVIDTAPMAQRVMDVRAELPSGLRRSGNVAVAEIDIPGIPKQMAAHSQVSDAGKGLIGSGNGNFVAQSVPNKAGDLVYRGIDTEYKILDNIADQLGSNTSARGTVNILTEKAACASCLNVAEQFKAKYPNITVNILDNKGVMLRPPRKMP